MTAIPYYARAPLGQTTPAPAPIAPATTSAVTTDTSSNGGSSGPNPLRGLLYVGGLIASAALTYHGYRRTQSVGWALVWGVLGGAAWPFALPIAFAQGFGQPAQRVARNRRRRRW